MTAPMPPDEDPDRHPPGNPKAGGIITDPGREPTHETELKLLLSSAEDFEALRRFLPPPRLLVKQHNIFLDTPDGALSSQRYGLRARLEVRQSLPRASGDLTHASDDLAPSRTSALLAPTNESALLAPTNESAILTPARESALLALKGPARLVAGATHRVDVEAPLDADLWHRIHQEGGIPLGALTGPAANLAATLIPPEAVLTVRVAFENQRLVHVLSLGGEERELLLDRTSFATGEVDYEIEVEVTLPAPPDDPRSRLLIHAVGHDLERLLVAAGVQAPRSPSGKLSRALGYAHE